jgi:ketosteroid isomerase-like protein
MSMTDEIREGYARYGRRDYGFMEDVFAQDIVWNTPGLESPLQGREAVRAFFGGLAQQFEAHTIALDDAVELDDRLICFCRHSFTPRGGEPVEVRSVMTWGVRDGQFTSLDEVADTLMFAIAAGMVDPAAIKQPSIA